jgi:amino acid adenylation domain-containing protein
VIARRAESILTRIAGVAVTSPHQIAVVDGVDSLTYGELDRRSTNFASQLLEAGAGPTRCVGLLIERSPAYIVAALAVMKGGAAYVPIDPSAPASRVSSILRDAGAIALVTTSHLASHVEAGPWRVLGFDVADLHGHVQLPDREPNPDDLAYVIYTSGSTGQPKGVEISHANLSNLIEWHLSAFGVTSSDRQSQIARLDFDAAVWEIWPALAAGATVVISDAVARRSSQALMDWIVAEAITVSFIPTVLAEELIRTSWPAGTRLRFLLTGGDTLRRRPASGLPFAVVNNYGPTECTVVATSGIVSAEGDANRPPSIGRPIANATALILDDSLRPVPPGDPGELCLSGALVGRGYRNRPELTERRFASYAGPSGELLRIYRTGDLVVQLSNGEIAFLGRLDDQIKIRGYRIEPGEIVVALNALPSIDTSAVSTTNISHGGPSLVAYVVPAGGIKPTASELRTHLAARVPDYMIPTFFVALPKLPLMPNGKLDRSALPAPCIENQLPDKAPSQELRPDTDPLRQRITALIASMLGRASIGADENFFMAGGHSMLGAELVSRIRDAFGVTLTLRQLFTAPTVSALSAEISQLVRTAK